MSKSTVYLHTCISAYVCVYFVPTCACDYFFQSCYISLMLMFFCWFFFSGNLSLAPLGYVNVKKNHTWTPTILRHVDTCHVTCLCSATVLTVYEEPEAQKMTLSVCLPSNSTNSVSLMDVADPLRRPCSTQGTTRPVRLCVRDTEIAAVRIWCAGTVHCHPGCQSEVHDIPYNSVIDARLCGTSMSCSLCFKDESGLIARKFLPRAGACRQRIPQL